MPVLSRPVRPLPSASWPILFGITAVIGCSRSDSARPVATARGSADSLIPAGPYGNSVRRGGAVLGAPQDRLAWPVGDKMRPIGCHPGVGPGGEGCLGWG